MSQRRAPIEDSLMSELYDHDEMVAAFDEFTQWDSEECERTFGLLLRRPIPRLEFYKAYLAWLDIYAARLRSKLAELGGCGHA